MQDFGVKKAKESEFLEIFTSKSSGTSSTIEDGIIVQSCRIGNHSCSSMCVQSGTQDSHVRSLIMMDKSSFSRKKARISSLEHVYKNFRLLRVLCIWGISTFDGTLPSEIGDLIHLRYLGLRWTNIRVFPKSFGQLRNLLTFECSHLAQYRNTEISIPNVLWKMDHLRHLLLAVRAATEEEYTFHTLKNLQSLRGVVGGEWMLKEMPTLSPTVKRLCIEDVSSMKQLDAVFQCPSIVSDHLRSLNLEWHKEKLYLEQQKLEVLCRCHHLRKLKLRGAIVDGMSSPVRFPSNLVKLVLCHAYLKSPETVAALGKLPSLRCLELLDEAYIGTEWVCRAGEFPQLEFLKVVNPSRLEDWRVEARAMPRLTRLKLQKCEVLERLPEELRNIASLEELMIACMPKTFLRRLRQDAGNGGEMADRGGGEDIHIIQHISRVTIL
ncbi:hypothetical protein Nepgr_020148 [Nepenthes gracilis]|uniref:Disease resistance R13L4/SHOC-2-like LRR domain-containing protein n=1 Tax=Nepenthes gracilis TaxID=150966 RepID=A0AAD3SWI2_NEPGR|nr:hypothetical protein Nepgr_020148 [Nepenthes gracilis]